MADEGREGAEPQVAEVALKMAMMLWGNSGMKAPTLNDQDFVKLVASCSMALQGRYALFDFRGRALEAEQGSDLDPSPSGFTGASLGPVPYR